MRIKCWTKQAIVQTAQERLKPNAGDRFSSLHWSVAASSSTLKNATLSDYLCAGTIHKYMLYIVLHKQKRRPSTMTHRGTHTECMHGWTCAGEHLQKIASHMTLKPGCRPERSLQNRHTETTQLARLATQDPGLVSHTMTTATGSLLHLAAQQHWYIRLRTLPSVLLCQCKLIQCKIFLIYRTKIANSFVNTFCLYQKLLA